MRRALTQTHQIDPPYPSHRWGSAIVSPGSNGWSATRNRGDDAKIGLRLKERSWWSSISRKPLKTFWKWWIRITLQETNISHLGKRKIIFKYALTGGYVNFSGGYLDQYHVVYIVSEDLCLLKARRAVETGGATGTLPSDDLDQATLALPSFHPSWPAYLYNVYECRHNVY